MASESVTSLIRIPAELWGRIFMYACIDGGRTGCAIGLVSKYIREVSARQRYRSVSLLNTQQIVAFDNMLSRMGGELHVVHLFISTKYDEGNGSGVRLSEEESQRGHDAIRRILATLSPSLQHLSLNFDGEMIAPHSIFDRTMPALKELELDGVHHLSLPAEALSHRLPALRRLHAVVNHNGRLIMQLVGLSGQLTHFRASSLYWELPEALNDALAALGTSISNIYIPQSTMHFPATIQAILLQPMVLDFNGSDQDAGDAAHANMLQELDGYASNDERVILLHPPAEGLSSGLQPQRLNDWLNRVQGGPGCWNVDPSVVRRVQAGLEMPDGDD